MEQDNRYLWIWLRICKRYLCDGYKQQNQNIIFAMYLLSLIRAHRHYWNVKRHMLRVNLAESAAAACRKKLCCVHNLYLGKGIYFYTMISILFILSSFHLLWQTAFSALHQISRTRYQTKEIRGTLRWRKAHWTNIVVLHWNKVKNSSFVHNLFVRFWKEWWA